MRSQRRTRSPWSLESLRRALEHHKQAGRVVRYVEPSETRARWQLELPNQPSLFEFSDRQVYALVCGLASAEHVARPAEAKLERVSECLDAVTEALGMQATSFTCAEADWIASAYKAIGLHGVAAEFLAQHAVGDVDEHDTHQPTGVHVDEATELHERILPSTRDVAEFTG